MTIFDFISEQKPKKIGPNCEGCQYKIFLHKGGQSRQSCSRYDGCEYKPKRGELYDER